MKPWAIVTGDFRNTGGMDRANFALAHFLAAQGVELHLVAFAVDPILTRFPNVTCHIAHKPLNAYGFGLPLLAKKARRVANQVAAAGGRVVINGGTLAFNDVNWVHYVHAAYTPQVSAGWRRIYRSLNHRRWQAEERAAIKAARLVITNSHRTSESLTELMGAAPAKLQCVYFGVDASVFKPASETDRQAIRQRLGLPLNQPVVLFVGALGDQRKGFDVLLSAWEQASARPSWNAVLVVAGAGADIRSWQKRIANAGLTASIRFLGFTNDIASLYQSADLMVSPTRYEAYGLAVHEALCCGVPTIVSAAAGVAERYPAELQHLLLPDVENPSDLTVRLHAWHANIPAYRAAVSALGEQLRSRSWDDMAAEMVELIEANSTSSVSVAAVNRAPAAELSASEAVHA